MHRRSTDNLLKLISRLNSSEKRLFRMAATKGSVKNELLFLQLFDHLDKYRLYDEQKILKSIRGIKKSQLPNLKSNLYKQLLSSLRSQKRHTIPAIAIRENLDYAVLLHSKGLYTAALDMLEKTKKMALEADRSISLLAALELEKHIEGLYITGSMYPKATILKEQTNRAIRQVTVNQRLSNLSLSLYGLYLQYGYVKDDRDYDFITDYFKQHLSDVDPESLDFYGHVYLYQSYVWYYNMIQDFANNYKYAQRWVDLFIHQPEWQKLELTLYIKGLHNVLNSLFMAQRYDKFAPMYEELLRLGDAQVKSMNRDQLSTFKLIEYIHGINQFFLTGNFKGGAQYVTQISIAIRQNEYDWDLNRILLFNYKIASIYFCNGDLGQTISHLREITNHVFPDFREDIQCFARILSLIAHFDLGNEALVKHQIKATYRYLSKIRHLQPALSSILSFVRRIPKIREENLKSEFVKLNNDLKDIKQTQFERRPFLYLDIISWLESKIEEVPVGEIIRRKAVIAQQKLSNA
jgi:hypothetical protein